MKIGIVKETKNKWEIRVPIVPKDVGILLKKYSIQTVIQPCDIRIFSDEDYKKSGAIVQDDLSDCSIIFGVKEMPKAIYKKGKTYVFFSHTIKGQSYNMPMLKKLIEMKCQLIDYEKITDTKGRRLIFFGRHAGYAGIVDALSFLGKRLKSEKIENQFLKIRTALEYEDLNDIKEHFKELGREIKREGFHSSILPVIIGIAGYGHVSKGVQEILNILPVKYIEPEEIQKIFKNPISNVIYVVVFKEKDIVKPKSKEQEFDLQDYYAHPEKYVACFDKYLPFLTMIINANYWTNKYPRLITRSDLKSLYKDRIERKLKIIADISCDIEGSIECNTHSTEPGDPAYVYNPISEKETNGYKGNGLVILAVDNLPAEIAKDSSAYFSHVLMKFIPEITQIDFSKRFDELNLPFEIENGLILHHGELTSHFKYMKKFLENFKGE
jgi:alpha-aminoadipic semialdehyde synthase